MTFTSADFLGGQQPRAARQIASHLDRIPREKYVEPFLGHGMVYRSMRNHEGKEFLSDLSCKQTGYVKKKLCSTKDPVKCDLLKKAKPRCKVDWKLMLKHDSSTTLTYLDPPYSGGSIDMYPDKDVPFDDFVSRIRKLKGSVAVSL